MDKNNTRGFTLIEMLIVTSIIILMSGTSLAIFSSFREDKIIGNQIILLTGLIELAKNKAGAGDVTLCSNSSTAHVSDYSIAISPTNMTMTPTCDTTPTPVVYSIPSNITYTPSSLTLRFDSQNYQGDDVNIIIKNTLTSKCKYVLLTQTGVVTNGDVTCP